MNDRLGISLALMFAIGVSATTVAADTTVVTQTFKPLTFDAPGSVKGVLSGSFGSRPVSGTFNGSIQFTGSLTFTAPDTASGHISGLGSVEGMVYGYGALPAAQFNGETGEGGAAIVAGKFSARFPDQPDFQAAEFTGTIDTNTFEAVGPVTYTTSGTIKASGKWKATLAPVPSSPLSVATTVSWASPGVMDVVVVADGSVQPAATPTTAVATVAFYWGSSTGGRISQLTDSISILWNQASGHYRVSNLPAAPADAISLIAVTRYGTTSKSKKLLLPVP